MAIPIFKVRAGDKGGAEKHSDYINRLGRYSKLDSDEKLEFAESFNMPAWAIDDPKKLWNAADEFERKNGTAYRRYVVAIPRELNLEQRKNFAIDLVQKEFGEKHPLSLAIHNKTALDGGEQPHVHVMVCERTLDGIERAPDQFFKRYNAKNPERGGAKKANTGLAPAVRKQLMQEQRHRVGEVINHHLALAGSDVRVDMRTLKAQGIDRVPINLTMEEITHPGIKSIYVENLNSRNAAAQAEKAVEDLLNERETQDTDRKIAEIEYRLPSLDRYTNLPNRLASAAGSGIAKTERVIELTKSEIASTASHIAAAERKIAEAAERLAAPTPFEPPKPMPAPAAELKPKPPAPAPAVMPPRPAPKPIPPFVSLADLMHMEMSMMVTYKPVNGWGKEETKTSINTFLQCVQTLDSIESGKYKKPVVQEGRYPRFESGRVEPKEILSFVPEQVIASRTLNDHEKLVLQNIENQLKGSDGVALLKDIALMPVSELAAKYPALGVDVAKLNVEDIRPRFKGATPPPEPLSMAEMLDHDQHQKFTEDTIKAFSGIFRTAESKQKFREDMEKDRPAPEPIPEKADTTRAEVERVEPPAEAPAAEVEKPTPAPRPKPRGP